MWELSFMWETRPLDLYAYVCEHCPWYYKRIRVSCTTIGTMTQLSVIKHNHISWTQRYAMH
jgi:hypothetical protein